MIMKILRFTTIKRAIYQYLNSTFIILIHFLHNVMVDLFIKFIKKNMICTSSFKEHILTLHERLEKEIR